MTSLVIILFPGSSDVVFMTSLVIILFPGSSDVVFMTSLVIILFPGSSDVVFMTSLVIILFPGSSDVVGWQIEFSVKQEVLSSKIELSWSDCYKRLIKEIIFIVIFFVP